MPYTKSIHRKGDIREENSKARLSQIEAYNRREYSRASFRYRTDSVLAECLATYASTGGTSVNMPITRLLCDYFNCQIPAKQYTEYDRVVLWPLELADLSAPFLNL